MFRFTANRSLIIANDIRKAPSISEKLSPLHNRTHLGSYSGYAYIDLNKTAKLGTSIEEEVAVENVRNKWMKRDDVMPSFADEQSKKLTGWEIPVGIVGLNEKRRRGESLRRIGLMFNRPRA